MTRCNDILEQPAPTIEAGECERNISSEILAEELGVSKLKHDKSDSAADYSLLSSLQCQKDRIFRLLRCESIESCAYGWFQGGIGLGLGRESYSEIRQ